MGEKIYQPYPIGHKSFAVSHDCDFDDKEKIYICNKCGKHFYHSRPFFDEPTMFTKNNPECHIYERDSFPEVYVDCEEDNPRYRTNPKTCVVLQERRGGYVLVKDENGSVSPLAINSLRVREVLQMDVSYKKNRYILLYNVLTKLKKEFPQIEIISPNDYDYFNVKELAKEYKIAKGFTFCTSNFKLYGYIDENPFFQRDVCLYHKEPCKPYVVGKNGVGDNGYSNCGTGVFSLGTSLMNITKDESGKSIQTPLTEDELYEHLRTSIIDTLDNY